jgi:dihydrofolate synthase/folylpolyglutamate synthase
MVLIAEAGVDVSVLEVGLGGRLDATNVVSAPIAAVTGVALDHEAILGTTLSAIAFEKAGIFKPGQHAFIGLAGEPEAVPLLIQHARDAGVGKLKVIDRPANLAVGLPGAHQAKNAALALALADELGVACDRAEVLAKLRVPGRFEIAGDLILDGAHNPNGALALAATLAERGIHPVLVIAVSADKNVAAIANALAPAVRAVIATRYQQERSLAPEAVADAFRACTTAVVETRQDLASALARARELGAPVLVAGSLFIVGEARVQCLGAAADPVVVSDPPPPV